MGPPQPVSRSCVMATGKLCGHQDQATTFHSDGEGEHRGQRTRHSPRPSEQIQEFLSFPGLLGFSPGQVELPKRGFPGANLGD